METTFHQPDWPFPDADEVCQRCKPMWKAFRMPYKRLAPVYDADGSVTRTAKKGIPIICCPYCDGTLIFDLPKDADHNE